MNVAPPPVKAAINQPTKRRTLLSAKEASELLSIPLASLYDLTRGNSLPGVIRIGHRIRYDLDALNDWLDEGGHKK